METQTAMTIEDIQAKLGELTAKRAELEKTLTQMSKDAALAMVAGEDMNKFEENRFKVAEENRHTGDLIAALEQALIDTAKNGDIQKLEKEFATREANNLLAREAKQRLEAAKRELSEAEAGVRHFDRLWQHSNDMIAHYKTKLKKEHRLTDIEISQIEAKFKP